MEGNVCLCSMVSCTACSSTVFCQKKCHKRKVATTTKIKKKIRNEKPEWTDISGPGTNPI